MKPYSSKHSLFKYISPFFIYLEKKKKTLFKNQENQY